MKSITLKEFCDIYDYKKFDKVHGLGLLAEECGVSISYISKLYNNRFVGSSNSSAFMKVHNFVKGKGYRLIKGDALSLGDSNISRENNRLKLELAYYEDKCRRLEEELASYEGLVKACDRIVGRYKKNRIG